jgi:hypothetical protein
MSDPALEGHWKKVLDDFADETRHGAFLEYCRATNQLLEAAVRYRGMAGDRDRVARARQGLTAVSLLAVAALDQHRTPPAPRSAGRWIIVAFFVVGSLALIWLFGRR